MVRFGFRWDSKPNLGTGMTRLDKFEDVNRWFISLGTRMTQPNKFEDLNDRFTSLGIGMTQSNKFR